MTSLLTTAPAFLSLILWFALHIVLWRNRDEKGLIFLGKLCIGTYFFTIGIVHIFGFPIHKHLWISAPVYAFFAILYLDFYSGMVRSLSLRIPEELAQAGGSMTFTQLEHRYGKHTMFTSRVELLCQQGWLRKRGDSYSPTQKAKVFGSTIIVLRALFGIKNAG